MSRGGLALMMGLVVAACGGVGTPRAKTSQAATNASAGPPLAGATASPAGERQITMKHEEVAGISFAYEEHGEGLPIVFLHGIPTDHRSVSNVLEPAFANHPGWLRIYPDLPGFGQMKADKSRKTADAYTEAIIAFVEAQAKAHGGKVALVGASWGAYAALAFLRKHPESLLGLALVVPRVHGGAKKPSPRALVVEAGVTDGEPKPLTEAFHQVATVQQRWVLDELKRSVRPGVQSADLEYGVGIEDQDLSYEDELPSLHFDKPSLIVAGKQDSLLGFDYANTLASGFSRGTLAILDRAGHALAVEQRDLLRTLLFEWLTRVREDATGTPRPAPDEP